MRLRVGHLAETDQVVARLPDQMVELCARVGYVHSIHPLSLSGAQPLREHFNLTAQSLVFQLIFRFGREEIETVTHTVEPIIIRWRAALCNPGRVRGSDVKDDLGKQAVTAREDFYTGYLILLNPSSHGEALHGFVEDRTCNRFECKGLNFACSKRTKDRWVLCWSGDGCIGRRQYCCSWWTACFRG